jgi:hypothetical protein
MEIFRKCATGGKCTENKIFLIYKAIQMGSGASSYTVHEEGLPNI